MILLCGIPSEAPLAMVRGAIEALGEPFLLFNQRRFDSMAAWFEIVDGRVSGRIVIGPDQHPLESITGVYTRLMDDRLLPELCNEPPLSPRRRQCRALHDTLSAWLEIAPARVVNRTAPMLSNGSKPLQAQMIQRLGFDIPETLVTNNPEAVRAFLDDRRRVVYKSISGTRSIVRELAKDDLARLDAIRWCPVQFQAFVPGHDVRVHVVGREVFATAIASPATDYRYATIDDDAEPPLLTAHQLDHDVAERCVRLAAALELPFAGIDLRFAPDGRVYCFEVNPSPGFSYYENRTGQPIARAVAAHLAGRS